MKASELLDKVLERPPLYIGRESVTLAKAFIDGYEFAVYEAGDSNRDLLYVGFQDWIAKRFHIKTAHDWAAIISFMGSSENGAFSLLQQLWKEYKTEIKKA